ncbi:MAG: putative Fe-S cluster assembly protein SufT [Acidimicrobiales bacterium]
MNGPAPVELRRDCRATLVPSGQLAVLAQGEQVVVVQQLGGSITVQTSRGLLARVDRADADALGLVAPAPSEEVPSAGAEFEPEQVIEQLRSVFDPEIPVNVVDLGLVYRCDVLPLGEGRHRVEIDMSMTAPGCGMGDVLRQDAEVKLLAVPGVAEVDVQLVWDPPWDLSRLSESARLELGLW